MFIVTSVIRVFQPPLEQCRDCTVFGCERKLLACRSLVVSRSLLHVLYCLCSSFLKDASVGAGVGYNGLIATSLAVVWFDTIALERVSAAGMR